MVNQKIKKLKNRWIRFCVNLFANNDLEQDLNKLKSNGTLCVPEISSCSREIAAEGIVLLKNEHRTLPLSETDTAAVFGRSAIDYFTVGFGSGGDVVSPYRSNLMEGLADRHVKVHKGLAQVYADWCSTPENEPDEGFWGHWPMSHPEMKLDEALVKKVSSESDAAIVVIGRAAGEDRENKLEEGSYYLTKAELQMLDLVTAHFARVAVVMDCGNVIDMGWTKRYGNKIGAIVYAWQGGMESGYALADVLTGAVNPSGKLTDTIAAAYEAYPSVGYFGQRKYNNYVEDIYVGYRYFETFAKDAVLYPFGFGLSYTTFEINASAKQENGRITVTASVTNTGDRSGREVVQVYLQKPNGKLGQPSRVLAGFQKTKLLQPGDKEEITVTFDLNEFASYDDSGVTSHRSCCVLESGTYMVSVGSNVREAKEVLCFDRAQTEVTEVLSEMCAVKPKCSFDRMVNRGNGLSYEPVPTVTKDLRKEILAGLPQPLSYQGAEIPFGKVLSGETSAEDFVAQLSLQELDDITHGQGPMNSPDGPKGNAGAFGGVTKSLKQRGIPPIITTDGPSGIRLRSICSLLPCGTALASTFDPEAVQALYTLLAKEMKILGTDMLLAPGMNIHRNPLGGRNFEYYSEDPFLTGKMASACIRGIQSQGASACPKHFACNNQEVNRNHNDSRLSERALREIYLKGFEIAVKEGSPKSIMTSYNKVNGAWSHYQYELCTGILRKEWGYDGLVITDWWMREGANEEFPRIKNDACRIRAQVDVLMPGAIAHRTLLKSLSDPDGVTLGEAQRSALNVIKFIIAAKGNGQ